MGARTYSRPDYRGLQEMRELYLMEQYRVTEDLIAFFVRLFTIQSAKFFRFYLEIKNR